MVSLALVSEAAAVNLTPSDTATSALERAAFVALPAVYDVRGTIRVTAIVTAGRRRTVDHTLQIHGTAFGVAPKRVVSALHLVSPANERLLDELRTLGVPNLPDDPAAARVVTDPVTRVTLRRARTAASAFACAGVVPPPIPAQVGLASANPDDDLVLLNIEDVDAPTLALDDSQTTDTRVAAIGFGDQESAIPVIRTGSVNQTAAIADNERFATIDIAVVRGDSGAPVIDEAGRSHGVVLRRESGETPPVMAQAASVRTLLAADGTSNRETAATTDFRAAMDTFWARDYPLAQGRLEALAKQSPAAALARCEAQQAGQLAAAPYGISGPSRTRNAVLAFGAMAALAAAILGIMRVRRQRLD